MKIIKPAYTFLLAVCLISCEKEESNLIVKDKIEGFVQKGPFINGTSIVISELNPSLMPTGRNFNTQIADNKGSFQVNNVSLASRFVELKAEGFYFNEVSGTPSTAPLTLYALSDLSDKASVNVNVLSYLEKARVEYLIGQGMQFHEAKRQAQKEILAPFNIQKDNTSQSETLDISRAGDDNAILLAVSVILQGSRTVAELSELLANFSTDIREDGILNSQTLGTKLINGVKYLNLAQVRQHVENRYADIGVEASIPDFEKYIKHFIDNTNFSYNPGFAYPATGVWGTNFLSLTSNTSLSSGSKYSFAANIPAGSSLKVVVKGISGLWYLNGTSINGWQVGNYDSETNTQIFTASKTGEVIDFELALSQSGSCLIEFYENNNAQPTATKTISWQEAAPDAKYPATGSYGTNLLSMATGSNVTAQSYSLTLNLPAYDEYAAEIKLVFEGTGTYSIDPAKVKNWQYTESGNQLTLKCSGKGITADMAITLSGEGKVTIQSTELNSIINWKQGTSILLPQQIHLN